MSALTNPVYLLLTDKTNRAGILMIIYIKSLYQRVRILIYFIFAMLLKFGIDPLYQAGLFDTFNKCHNLHICCHTSLFDMH